MSDANGIVPHNTRVIKCRLVYRVNSRGEITFGVRKRSYTTRQDSAVARAIQVTDKGRAYLKELEAENA